MENSILKIFGSVDVKITLLTSVLNAGLGIYTGVITEPNHHLATNLLSAAKVSLDLPHFLFQFFLSAICGD